MKNMTSSVKFLQITKTYFFLKLRYFINKTILSKLHTCLSQRFPLIKADNNCRQFDPINTDKTETYFSMYLLTKSTENILVLHFNQFLAGYIDLIINSIDEFFRSLNKGDIITSRYKFN